ncbi:MAG: lipoprotein [Cyclobacteriaceae bacterium]|nr:lipoprotein [Cyclobacteriaceae bacterium]
MKKTILFLFLLVVLASCASHKQPKRNKAPKPGKPIPCPMKDC